MLYKASDDPASLPMILYSVLFSPGETEHRIPLSITAVLIILFPHDSEAKRARIDTADYSTHRDSRGVVGTQRGGS